MLRVLHFVASKKKVFVLPGNQITQQFFATSPDPRMAEIGDNRFIVPSAWSGEPGAFWDLMDQIFSKNNVMLFIGGISANERKMGTWYTAHETVR